jgi:hypothetical protein
MDTQERPAKLKLVVLAQGLKPPHREGATIYRRPVCGFGVSNADARSVDAEVEVMTGDRWVGNHDVCRDIAAKPVRSIADLKALAGARPATDHQLDARDAADARWLSRRRAEHQTITPADSRPAERLVSCEQ